MMVKDKKACLNRPLTPSEIQVVVMMGGLGTRLKQETAQCPKPLIDVNGVPFFQYQLELMIKQGFQKFLFCVGYRANMIEEYFGAGDRWGIKIDYSYDGPQLLGTGGAIRKAYHMLEEDFMVIYGDSFMDIDYEEVLYRYYQGRKNGKCALMTILHNKNRLDKSNVEFADGELQLYDKWSPTCNMEYIDYGVSLFTKEIFREISEGEPCDLAKLQHELSLKKELTGCEVLNRFYEIGTPESLNEFRSYVQKRFLHAGKAVFLDRDGVINEIVFNEDTEQLDSPLSLEQFSWKTGVFEALKTLQDLGYYIFIVTNQPAAAKGKTDLGTLYDINKFMRKELSEQGIHIERVFMCPHYPKECANTKEQFLIKDCECRKPKDGLLRQAADRYCLNKEDSFMVGDSCTDISAGKKFGIRTVLIGQFKCDMCQMLQGDKPDKIVNSLAEYAELLKENERC